LTSVTVSNGWRSEFTYDGRGRMRVKKEFAWRSGWSLTNETRFVYDGMLVIQERDALNLPQVSYVRGKDLGGGLQRAGGIGGLLARVNHQLASSSSLLATTFYHCDGNGNVTGMFATNGLMVAWYLYDPYGNTLAANGPLAEANVYHFSSKAYHEPSGLYYYGYRFYSPNLQRWVNPDPIGEAGGINLYVIVGNRVTILVDPLGLAWFDDLANWAQCQHEEFSGSMLGTSGEGNNWLLVGTVNTGSELLAGVLSYPQAISQVGTGTGYFYEDPSLENAPGMLNDIAICADLLAAGAAPLPSLNKPLNTPCKPKPCAAKTAPKLLGPGTQFGAKIEGQLAKRGWTKDLVQSTIDKPTRTVPWSDTRHLPGGGRMNDPATAFYGERGGYVVRNNRTGDIIQVSDRTDPGWKAPWD
jgi:RHS repeat-associated protein